MYRLVIWPILIVLFLCLGLVLGLNIVTIGVLPIIIVLLFVVGLIMMLIEVLIIPGFGIAGILSIFFLATGIYLSWTGLNLAWAVGTTLVGISSIVLTIAFLKKSGLTGRMVLKHHVGKPAPSPAVPDQAGEIGKNQAEGTGKKDSVIFVGQTGLSISDLRPAGIANFQGHRLNVLTDGTYIRRNTQIKIIKIEGNRIFVEEDR
ncbi:MAG: NfeD family protein [bacterium]